jgi:hypothetical protein
MQPMPDRLERFERAALLHGSHDSIDEGGCAMEWASYLAGEPHSDHPKCVSKVIGAFVRSWNDALPHDKRQILKDRIPRLLGTAGSEEIEDRRAWLVTDWLVRVYLPTWLELAKLTQDADQIRALPEITSATINATLPTLKAAQKNAAAAWDAASAAAWDAWDAARAAAWDAARAAARDAAWDATSAAASAAAWDAAWAAAWDAARAAAWDAARAAARDAAWDAASTALQPTVEELQASALELLDRMIQVEDPSPFKHARTEAE